MLAIDASSARGRSAADRCPVIGGQLAVQEKADQNGSKKDTFIYYSVFSLSALPRLLRRRVLVSKNRTFCKASSFWCFLTEARERLVVFFPHVKNAMKSSGAAQL